MKLLHEFDDVHHGQQLFRKILKAMSNPLVTVDISSEVDKISGADREEQAVAFTLINNETTFCSYNHKELDAAILAVTLSHRVPCSTADYIFTHTEEDMLQSIENAKCGTLLNPHKSATIIVKIPSTQDCSITMCGAGIKDTITLETNSMVQKTLQKRDSMCFEYPTGLDFIFINDNKELFAIPRLTRMVKQHSVTEKK